uniref:Uncharacterized protein n=1 Tax=viral metagenome TaxID=1070528 RepID=A0A6C0CZN9_9ZZZZ
MTSEYYNITLEFLKSKFPEFVDFNHAKKHYLIFGKPQSGKSVFTFGIALLHILKGTSCVMVLRDSTKDALQIKNKAKLFSIEHSNYMKMIGKSDCPKLEVVLANAISSNRKTGDLSNYEPILNAITGDKKKLIIAMNNGYQLQYLNRVICEHISHDFNNIVLLTDEADEVGYAVIHTEKQPHFHASLEYKEMYDRAQNVYEISATIFDILIGNEDLTNKNIIVLNPSSTYKGIENSLNFIILKHKVLPWSVDDPIISDLNLIPIYNELSNKNIFISSQYNCPIDHPIIILHKTNTRHAHHDAFYDYFIDNKEFNKIWTVITEDSRGIRIYNKHLKSKTIKICREKLVDKDGSGVFNFTNSNIDIQDILQYFIDNGGVKKFSHIVIKAGLTAGRCRSYVSTNGQWHLTHMYYIPSKGVKVPQLIQSCRLNHDRPDNIPLTMYAHNKTINDIQKGNTLQDEQLDRLNKLKTESYTSDQIEKEIWNINKVPKSKLCVSKLHNNFKPITIHQDDNGWDISQYTKTITNIQELDETETKYYLIDPENMKIGTIGRVIIDEVIKQIIIHKKIGNTVLRTVINKWLMDTGKDEFKYTDQINGMFDSFIKNKMEIVYNIDTTGLLYWKENKRWYLQLNS